MLELTFRADLSMRPKGDKVDKEGKEGKGGYNIFSDVKSNA